MKVGCSPRPKNIAVAGYNSNKGELQGIYEARHLCHVFEHVTVGVNVMCEKTFLGIDLSCNCD